MKRQANLTITRGLPASGKTTWARALVAERPVGSIIRLNRDDLRRTMIDPNYRTPVRDAEARVTEVQQESARAALSAGVDVVIDDTNLRLAIARGWANMAVQTQSTFTVREFSVPLEECLRRDGERHGIARVGETVIRNMHDKYVRQHIRNGVQTLPPVVADEQVTGKPYVAQPGTPKAVMVDIDGTVADHEGVRSPYDTTRYHLDKPKADVLHVVWAMWLAGHEVVFCSGREEAYRKVTEAWLDEHLPSAAVYAGLFMRPTGDKRNDAVVKLELFDEHIRNRYNVVMVFDDRDRVVDAWRSIGLTVAQVAPGAF